MGYMIELMVNGEPLDAYEAIPSVEKGNEIKGGIIVLHEIWALNDHTKDIADRYADEGYYALAPNLLAETDIAEHAAQLQLDYFNPEKRNEAQPKLRELMTPMREPDFGDKTLARVKTCFDYLYNKPELHQWIAITGYCFGGTYSFALATVEPRLKAAVPYYGHPDLENATALQSITCPILAFYGQNDERLISDLPKVRDAMAAAGVDFTTQVYSDCAHAFFNDTNPYAYNEAAAKDSWQRSMAFLSANA